MVSGFKSGGLRSVYHKTKQTYLHKKGGTPAPRIWWHYQHPDPLDLSADYWLSLLKSQDRHLVDAPPEILADWLANGNYVNHTSYISVLRQYADGTHHILIDSDRKEMQAVFKHQIDNAVRDSNNPFVTYDDGGLIVLSTNYSAHFPEQLLFTRGMDHSEVRDHAQNLWQLYNEKGFTTRKELADYLFHFVYSDVQDTPFGWKPMYLDAPFKMRNTRKEDVYLNKMREDKHNVNLPSIFSALNKSLTRTCFPIYVRYEADEVSVKQTYLEYVPRSVDNVAYIVFFIGLFPMEQSGHNNLMFWDLDIDTVFWIEPHGGCQYKSFYELTNDTSVLNIYRKCFSEIETIEELPKQIRWDARKRAWSSFEEDMNLVFLCHTDDCSGLHSGLQSYLRTDLGYCVSISSLLFYIILTNADKLHGSDDYTSLLKRAVFTLSFLGMAEDFLEEVSYGFYMMSEGMKNIELVKTTFESRRDRKGRRGALVTIT